MLPRSTFVAAWLLAVACETTPQHSDTGPDPDRDPLPTDAQIGAAPSGSWWPEGGAVLPAVTVVDGDGARGPRWVVLDGDRIHAILDAPPPPGSGLRRLPVEGRFVAPGLVDPHVHLFLSGATVDVGDTLEANLRAQLWFGVTSVVDAGGPETAAGLARMAERQDWRGPSVKVLSPFVTAPRSHPCETWNQPSRCWFVEVRGDGALLGERAIDKGFDGVKVALTGAEHTRWPTPRLDPDEAAGAFAAATAAGRLAYAHVDSVEDALDALEAGAGHLAHPVFGGELGAADAVRLAEASDAVHTTLGAFDGTGRLLDDDIAWAELEGVVPEVVLADWRFVRDNPDALVDGWVEGSAEWTASAARSVARLVQADARVLPASDAGYLFVPHGAGLHHELEALLEADPRRDRLAVLSAATEEAARAVGWTDRGAVRVGMRADLLVLDGDPSQDLAALRRPLRVIVGGRAWTREALAEDWRSLATPEPAELGAFCIGGPDCASGRCDGWTHTCQPGCSVAWSVDNDCGPDAVCVEGEGGPVCRPVRDCDPYAPDCAPDAYDEACVPSDRDTAVCWPSGPQQEWEACGFVDPATFCEAGLDCSPFDAVCYRICDPDAADPGCGGGTSCRMQQVDGEDWYGLCLP